MALPALAENLHIEEPRVFINNGKAVTTSQDVADYFNKLHKDVLKKINLLDCSPKFNERNFAPVDYVDAKGEKRPMFEITKDGFVFLVMGFTGKKAAAFKEAYIAEFNRMEAALTYPNYSQATLGDLTGTAATAELAALVDKLQRIIHEGEFIPAGSRRNYNLPANRKHEQTIIRDFLTKDESSTLLMLLAWLRADGFDMTAAERELDVIRGYVGSMRRSMGDIQTHAQYIDHAVRLVS